MSDYRDDVLYIINYLFFCDFLFFRPASLKTVQALPNPSAVYEKMLKNGGYSRRDSHTQTVCCLKRTGRHNFAKNMLIHPYAGQNIARCAIYHWTVVC